MINHQTYIRRCIELAQNGLGTTFPNPLVGSVIVYDGKIIGEGWHQKAGGPHAEVVAINSVKDKSQLPLSTLYVNLEPCSHFGKTPPCCNLIVASKIKNVVVGMVDPNEKVAGKGVAALMSAGVNVTVGVLENECRHANRRFLTSIEKQRPYIILKWAQTADGFIAPDSDIRRNDNKEATPYWITNQYSRQLVHMWRSQENAILIGTNTAIDDNPKLDVRQWSGINPVRIVLDRNRRIPKENHIFGNEAITIQVSDINSKRPDDETDAIDFSQNIATQLAGLMQRHQIQSVIIEGGRQTIQTFIDENLWDEARIFEGHVSFKYGIAAPILRTGSSKINSVDGDQLLIYYNYD